MYKNFSFEILKNHNKFDKARIAKLNTPHGTIETPAFWFCATKAAIKSLNPQNMLEANTQSLLCNTYHLMVYPGAELIEKFGGLHAFMGWNKPILTDSGGFQIFSLGHGSVSDEIKGKRNSGHKSLSSITEEGAVFKSYRDGSMHTLTPEKAMEVQKKLGSDLVVVLDECTAFNVPQSYTYNSMQRSHRWAVRSMEAFSKNDDGKQAVYGVVQGGIYKEFREEAAKFINDLPVFGNAIGGSLGANKDQMEEVVKTTMSYLSKERPVHLLGIGGMVDIIKGVKVGIDTFDCVHPTRIARHGGALVPFRVRKTKDREYINLNQSNYSESKEPIDDQCACYTCSNFSKGYLHYGIKAKEMVALQLISIHNVFTMNKLMEEIRVCIKNDQDFDSLEKEWIG